MKFNMVDKADKFHLVKKYIPYNCIICFLLIHSLLSILKPLKILGRLSTYHLLSHIISMKHRIVLWHILWHFSCTNKDHNLYKNHLVLTVNLPHKLELFQELLQVLRPKVRHKTFLHHNYLLNQIQLSFLCSIRVSRTLRSLHSIHS